MVPIPASLLTPPLHDSCPEQVTVQRSPWQSTPFEQLFNPEQMICSAFPPPSTLLAQLCGPMHLTVHCAPPH